MHPHQRPPSEVHGSTLQGITVVEDDPICREFMVDLLKLWGFQVQAFSDPVDALADFFLTPNAPNLILTDLHFSSGMDGFDLIEGLRATHESQFIPAIVVTGDLSNVQQQRASDHHVGFIQKPFRPDVLRRVMSEQRRLYPPVATAN